MGQSSTKIRNKKKESDSLFVRNNKLPFANPDKICSERDLEEKSTPVISVDLPKPYLDDGSTVEACELVDLDIETPAVVEIVETVDSNGSKKKVHFNDFVEEKFVADDGPLEEVVNSPCESSSDSEDDSCSEEEEEADSEEEGEIDDLEEIETDTEKNEDTYTEERNKTEAVEADDSYVTSLICSTEQKTGYSDQKHLNSSDDKSLKVPVHSVDTDKIINGIGLLTTPGEENVKSYISTLGLTENRRVQILTPIEEFLTPRSDHQSANNVQSSIPTDDLEAFICSQPCDEVLDCSRFMSNHYSKNIVSSAPSTNGYISPLPRHELKSNRHVIGKKNWTRKANFSLLPLDTFLADRSARKFVLGKLDAVPPIKR